MSRKHNTKRSGRRVRPLLLLLVWIWAICMFMVVDLFRNVTAFDGIRPRARTYRTMRLAAHRMVGEPYLENDEFAEAGAPPPRQASRGVARRYSTRAIAESWRHGNGRAPVSALLRMRGDVPRAYLGRYALDAAAAVAELATGGERALEGVQIELARASVDALAERLGPCTTDVGVEDWRSARVALERIDWVAPGFHRASGYGPPMERIRSAVDQAVGAGAAGADGVGDAAMIETLRLASTVGNERTAGACLRLLQQRCRVRAPTREAGLVREHALRAVLRCGSSKQRTELYAWLDLAQSRATDPYAQRRLLGWRRMLDEAATGAGLDG